MRSGLYVQTEYNKQADWVPFNVLSFTFEADLGTKMGTQSTIC
jgi:hypothetical protein